MHFTIEILFPLLYRIESCLSRHIEDYEGAHGFFVIDPENERTIIPIILYSVPAHCMPSYILYLVMLPNLS